MAPTRSPCPGAKFLILLTVTFLGLHVSGQNQGQGQFAIPTIPTNHTATNQIVNGLATVTAGRQTLVIRLDQLRNKLKELKVQRSEGKARCACRDISPVAFTSFLEKDVPNFGDLQTMPFTNVTINIGNAYNSDFSEFTAPSNGTYIFFVTIATESGYQLVVDLVLDGTLILKVRSGNDKQWNTATNSAVLHLRAGQDVWVQQRSGGSNRLFKSDGMFSSFSGHLIDRD